jgi:hypothetical protein
LFECIVFILPFTVAFFIDASCSRAVHGSGRRIQTGSETVSESESCYAARMDIGKAIAELRAEHERVSAMIANLESAAASQQNRRGRPPLWLLSARSSDAPKRRGRPAGKGNAPRQARKQQPIFTNNAMLRLEQVKTRRPGSYFTM